MIYKFVTHDVSPLESHKGGRHFELHARLEDGQEPTREEKNDLLVFSSPDWVYKYHGYAYDFREFLNEYYVETEYYGIIKVWAWDKTSIRKNSSTKWLKIHRIVEVQ